MIILPAIDLMSGEVVRLRQGKAAEKTVYSTDPVAIARKWEEEGGDYLHIVDLDAAFSGTLQNLEVVKRITESISIPCQLGGGMRSEEAMAQAFAAGVSRVVIGTRAGESIRFVEDAVNQFGGNRIAVGIDARDGLVSIKGWTEGTNRRAVDLAKEAEQAGAATVIYTDIATDGMMAGPNVTELERLLEAIECQVIASGGVSCAADVQRLGELKGIYGVIVGKALYEGTLTLAEIAPDF